MHIGSLVIKGDNERLTHDLPSGSHLRITVHQDESREVKCVAYVELLDDEFDGVITKEGFAIDANSVSTRFTAAKSVLEEAKKLQAEFPTPGLDEKFKIIDDLKTVDEIAKEAGRAEQGEKDALYRAYRRVLELAGALQIISDAQTEAHNRRHIAHLKQAVRDQEVKDLDAIEAEFTRAVREKDRKQFSKTQEALAELDQRVRVRPYFDVLIDLMAESGQRVSARQGQIFKEAEALIERLNAKGGIASLSSSDLAELEALHKQFIENYPDLQERRQKWFAEQGDRQPTESLRDRLGDGLRKADTSRNY